MATRRLMPPRTGDTPPTVKRVPSTADENAGPPSAQDGAHGELRYDAAGGRLYVRCRDDWWYMPLTPNE